MKKVLLFIVLLIMPISVSALSCSYDKCIIKYDQTNDKFTCGDNRASINNNNLKSLFKTGTCPPEDAISIICGNDIANMTTCTVTVKDKAIIQEYVNANKKQQEATEKRDSKKSESSKEESLFTGSEYEAVKKIDFCEESGVQVSFKVIGMLIFIAKIIVPLLLIIFGVMDFYKAMVNSDEKTTKEAFHTFARRIIAGIIVFFIPTIIGVILGLVDDYSKTKNDHSKCQDCLLHPIKKCTVSLNKK